MVQKKFAVALDIKRPTANRDFEVVEGDNGNVLEIELTDDGTAVDLASCLVVAVFSKSDGAAQQDSDSHGITVDTEQTNKLTISLYSTRVAPGLVECELQVFSGEDHTTLITSAKFNFMCRRGIANDDVVQATEEWPLLISALNRVEAAHDGLETLTQTVEDTMANLTQDVGDTLVALNSLTTTAAGAANAAATTANTAAGNANAAAGTANAAADAANTATGYADAAADTANTASGQAISAAAYAHEQGDYAKAMGEAAEGILNAGITWNTLPGKPTEFTPEAHAHGSITDDGKIGSAAGFVMTDADGDVYSESNAATVRGALGAASAADVDALEAAGVPITTGGTPTAYTITPTPSITAYVNDGSQSWTVYFHADSGDNPTFNVSGLGAGPLLQYFGKAAKVKGGQIVRVVRKGTNFFLANAGGGIELPATIAAGNTVIYAKLGGNVSNTSESFYNVGTGWGFQAAIAGVYRFTFGLALAWKYNWVDARLTRNGVEVPTTAIRANITVLPFYVEKTIDISMAAGDIVRMQVSSANPSNTYALATQFIVSISANSFQAEINTIGIGV